MIIRVKKKDEPYVLIRKHFINDKTLSLKAKGIMTYLLSKPDGWHVQVKDLENQNKDGDKSIRSGIKELKESGYMVPVIQRDESGRIIKYDYDVHEEPVPQKGKVAYPLPHKRQVAKRQVAKRQVENRHVNKELLKQDNELSKDSIHVNNNNSLIKRGSEKDIIITVPIKYKRKFNKIKKSIMEIGWVGPLDEIVTLHNDDPDYVRGWVERISDINKNTPGNWGGLLRKSLRSGERVPTLEDIEKESRNKYTEDPLAKYIEGVA